MTKCNACITDLSFIYIQSTKYIQLKLRINIQHYKKSLYTRKFEIHARRTRAPSTASGAILILNFSFMVHLAVAPDASASLVLVGGKWEVLWITRQTHEMCEYYRSTLCMLAVYVDLLFIFMLSTFSGCLVGLDVLYVIFWKLIWIN